MENQLINNANALRLFFNDEVFVVEDKSVEMPHFNNAEAVSASIEKIESPVVTIPVAPEAPVQKVSITEIPAIHTPPVSAKTFKFLGGNQKSVLILVNDAQNPVSSEQGRELLRKIVKAVDLATPDFAVVNYANYSGTTYAELKFFFKPKIVLSFGVDFSAISLSLTWQGDILLHENVKLIFAPNLHDLEQSREGKVALWANLQKIK
ncbi:hypothetical protein [Pedobacter sp. MW01-1-1]|uniref:hypothetical protein n=1 Tax=Pedobacter sp. MW01-1-1 TaxID=3383027 RepID=UPI003FF09E7A